MATQNPRNASSARMDGVTPVESATLDALYASVPAMMHSIDASGRLIQVSDMWLATLGFERREVIGRLSSDFLTESSRTYAREVILPAFFRTGRCDDVEYQMIRRDGTVIDVLLSGRLLRDASGNAFRSIAVIRDITDKKKLDCALSESEQRYRALFQHVQAGFALLELDAMKGGAPALIFVAANPEFSILCGLPQSRIVGERAGDVFASMIQESSRCDAVLHEVAQTGARKALSNLSGLEGRWFDMVCYRPGVRQCAILVQETTQRKRMQEMLTRQHEQIRVTLHSIGDAVIAADTTGRVQYLNPMAERLTGWLSEHATDRSIDDVFHVFDERTGAQAANPVKRCLVEDRAIQLDDDTVLVSRDGQRFCIEDSAAPIKDSNGVTSGVVLVFRDVTEERQISKEMEHRATHDALTGLINRTEFEARLLRVLDGERDATRPGAVFYLDLDQFKLVNDTCGHAAGDALLKQVASQLDDSLDVRHTLARLGGDEFGIILDACAIGEAEEVASRLCRRLDEMRFDYNGFHICVGASIGVVPLDSQLESVDAIMQQVDSACYTAKDAGRNRIHVWTPTDQAMRARKDEMDWVRRLRQALDENRFVLYAQEIIPLQTPATSKRFEVLLRLNGEEGKLIPPGEFLPAAERFHIASRIDRWVVNQVFRWMASYSDKLDHIEYVSVNISGQSIGDAEFLDYIRRLLHGYPFNGSKLCFEVTETAAVTNLDVAASFINALRRYGVRFALDDFGSGASSFGYLKALPVNYLKIDGRFVRNLHQDALDRTVVRCIQEVANVLGKETIAEFVETAEISAILTEMGVGSAQGFFLHRPQPISVMLACRSTSGIERPGRPPEPSPGPSHEPFFSRDKSIGAKPSTDTSRT
ncbi:EAL domain-containing protein [Burkholderia sp. Bp8963]|uniref:EAL domain-containing protein n=1 Tax=Burkholderia sp. Bp8963 TaxID=2184547 RepID=UPI000F5A0BA3|nr:EAL domain-containing protein [Burkholderia sp. Bp8963]RQS74448.1 EAL domain-containing protein [Burkholderia sp. Bp8963]